jgi:hypothetical protein
LPPLQPWPTQSSGPYTFPNIWMKCTNSLLYTMAYGPGSHIDLLHWAGKNWTNTHPYTWYRPSYHTTLPNHWAQQFLGLNFTCLVLTNHLQSHLYKLKAIQQWQQLQSSTRKNDKIHTASCTYIHVLSLCHLYLLPVTWRVTNENFQKILFSCNASHNFTPKRNELRYHGCLSQLYFIGH